METFLFCILCTLRVFIHPSYDYLQCCSPPLTSGLIYRPYNHEGVSSTVFSCWAPIFWNRFLRVIREANPAEVFKLKPPRLKYTDAGYNVIILRRVRDQSFCQRTGVLPLWNHRRPACVTRCTDGWRPAGLLGWCADRTRHCLSTPDWEGAQHHTLAQTVSHGSFMYIFSSYCIWNTSTPVYLNSIAWSVCLMWYTVIWQICF